MTLFALRSALVAWGLTATFWSPDYIFRFSFQRLQVVSTRLSIDRYTGAMRLLDRGVLW